MRAATALAVIALAALAILISACTPDPVATVKAWKPQPMGGETFGKAVHDFPYFKYTVWNNFQSDPDTIIVECSGEFDLAALHLACPEIVSQDAKPAYRAFCIIRLGIKAKSGEIFVDSAQIKTYDAKGYYFQSDLDDTILARLAAKDKLLDCLTLYAKPMFSGM